ncbi:MAG: class I SAM-dependent methyltransferase [Chloroflexi bacterium]|nr:MAG: class I SAM-dependent methyltransferase [Chloroflexota bacterium]
MDPKQIVRSGYDAASYHYRSDADLRPGDYPSEATLHYHDWLDRLEPLLSPDARLLELGCGCGLPVARRLTSKYRYTGVDLSPVQCRRAQENAPTAEILSADMTALDFPPANFDAILAFFSIIHIPVEEQPLLYKRITSWLRPGGLFMVTLPLTAWTGTEDNWHDSGATMYWSHADTPTYLQWLDVLGFDILWTSFLPEGENGFNLVLAEKKLQ